MTQINTDFSGSTASTVNAVSYRSIGAFVVLLMVLLRIAWIESDAYPRLTWSSALVTDEGFYIHNARNLVLFGHERLDGFNNMLIMPLLHLAQVCVFRMFGVGVVQIRSLSIVASLLTLVLFWDASCRSWGRTVANIAVVFLGLDHVNLLYNRLGLMDTPCVLLMVASWWAAVRGRDASVRAEERGGVGRVLFATVSAWFALAGVCVVAAYAVRGLAVLILWLPLVFVFGRRSNSGAGGGVTKRPLLLSAVAGYLVGLTLAGLTYVMLWWLPNRVELAFVNHYYLHKQLLPQDLRRLAINIGNSFTDWQRGLFPYLIKHTPIQLLLSLVVFWSYRSKRLLSHCATEPRFEALPPASSNSRAAMLGWLAMLLVFCCCVNYSPSRYYVLFYPALAALAAIGLVEVSGRFSSPRRALMALLGLWAVINIAWLGDWMAHLTYRQQAADHWLAQHLPANSILLGAWAPGLCLDNRLHAWNVMQDLCNDDHPVERTGATPAYIVILDDGNWNEVWWLRHYPALVARDRRIHAFNRLLRPYFVIGVYPANRQALSETKEIQAQQVEIDR